MNRRNFFAAITGFAATSQSTDSRKKFYVTSPGTVISGRHPVFVLATDRLDAVMQLDLTVWTQQEWDQAAKALASCRRGNEPCFFPAVDYWKTGEFTK